jgi:hypothetical protein
VLFGDNFFFFFPVIQTAYIDVCDDKEYSRRAKSFHQKAIMMEVPAITTTGIYPGVSNSGFLQSDTSSRISMSSWFLNLNLTIFLKSCAIDIISKG